MGKISLLNSRFCDIDARHQVFIDLHFTKNICILLLPLPIPVMLLLCRTQSGSALAEWAEMSRGRFGLEYYAVFSFILLTYFINQYFNKYSIKISNKLLIVCSSSIMLITERWSGLKLFYYKQSVNSFYRKVYVNIVQWGTEAEGCVGCHHFLSEGKFLTFWYFGGTPPLSYMWWVVSPSRVPLWMIWYLGLGN